MLVKHLDKVEKIKPDMKGAEGVYKQVPLSKNDGAPVFSFRVFTVASGGHTPLHNHPYEHMNYVISGEGVLVDGDNGGKEQKIEPGDFALILPDETHQFRNTLADRPLVIICAVPKEYE